MKNIVINIPKEIIQSEQNWYFQRKLVSIVKNLEMETFAMREGFHRIDTMFINRSTYDEFFYFYKKGISMINVYYREEIPNSTFRLVSKSDIVADIHVIYGQKLTFKDFVKSEKYLKA
jgi:hypothetical protein